MHRPCSAPRIADALRRLGQRRLRRRQLGRRRPRAQADSAGGGSAGGDLGGGDSGGWRLGRQRLGQRRLGLERGLSDQAAASARAAAARASVMRPAATWAAALHNAMVIWRRRVQGVGEAADLGQRRSCQAQSGRDDRLRSPATRRASCRGRRRVLQGCRTCLCELRVRGLCVR